MKSRCVGRYALSAALGSAALLSGLLFPLLATPSVMESPVPAQTIAAPIDISQTTAPSADVVIIVGGPAHRYHHLGGSAAANVVRADAFPVIVAALERLESAVGDRFRPSEALREYAKRGGFYG